MRKIKQFFGAVAMTLAVGLASITAYAEDYYDGAFLDGNPSTIETPYSYTFNPITTLDVNPPKGETTSLPYKAQPYELYAGCSSYTLYGFETSTGKIYCDYEFEACRPDHGLVGLQLILYKRSEHKFLWFTNYSWERVDSDLTTFDDTTGENIPPYKNGKPKTGTMTFSNLSTSDVYCLEIKNITVDDPNQDYNSITATVTIRDR